MKAKLKNQRIPLCRSCFLQDITIALGRRSKGFCYSLVKFDCDVSTAECKEGRMECLSISGELHDKSRVAIEIWEDSIAQLIYSRKDSTLPKAFKWTFSPDITDFTPEGIVFALKDTFGCTSGIFYGESYFNRLRAIWEYQGSIEVENSPQEI